MTRKPKDSDLTTYEGRLAARLRHLREKTGLSVAYVSDKIGVTITTVYNWETGVRTPPYSALPILATLYKVSLRTLLPEL